MMVQFGIVLELAKLGMTSVSGEISLRLFIKTKTKIDCFSPRKERSQIKVNVQCIISLFKTTLSNFRYQPLIFSDPARGKIFFICLSSSRFFTGRIHLEVERWYRSVCSQPQPSSVAWQDDFWIRAKMFWSCLFWR